MCIRDRNDIATALTGGSSPLQDKDPYDGGAAAVSAGGDNPEGNTVITGTEATEAAPETTITFVTQFSKSASDTLTNTIDVE